MSNFCWWEELDPEARCSLPFSRKYDTDLWMGDIEGGDYGRVAGEPD